MNRNVNVCAAEIHRNTETLDSLLVEPRRAHHDPPDRACHTSSSFASSSCFTPGIVHLDRCCLPNRLQPDSAVGQDSLLVSLSFPSFLSSPFAPISAIALFLFSHIFSLVRRAFANQPSFATYLFRLRPGSSFSTSSSFSSFGNVVDLEQEPPHHFAAFSS